MTSDTTFSASPPSAAALKEIEEVADAQKSPSSASSLTESSGSSDIIEPVSESTLEITKTEVSEKIVAVAVDERPETPPPPFSAFSKNQKWTIAGLCSLAAIFGPISSNIYVPAIPQIVKDFHKTTQTIDLTLTVYLVFQAVSPSFLSNLSDFLGRRPVIMACMALYIIACIGIALTPTSDFWLLMVFRALQACGGSPAIATGAGAMGDIATPAERGKYVGLFQGVAMVGPAFGPTIGGILVQYLSWRYIFWLLSAWCGANLICIFFLIPETLRSIVGNGSIPPPALNCRPTDWWRRMKAKRTEDVETQNVQRPEKKPYKPWASFNMLLFPEILIVLAFSSCSFACMFASLTVLSSVLADDYGLNNVQIGLCYLPQGIGCMVIGVLGGRFQDWYFQREKKRLNFHPKHPRDLEGFPIERVRFATVPYYLPFWAAACIGYGFMLEKRVNLAGPLVLSFFIGAGTQFSSQTSQLILVDMFPSNAGASSASSNLVRCTFSAIMTACVTPMLNAIGLGCTFIIFVSLTIAACPFLLILAAKGPGWRKKRAKKWDHK
ncbi:hypothetical protein ASPZODRAFT_128863 [Penicilliopsis zonata CBS 506.65]|uniref:Citrate exporter 1 n=1 Tax=Penicilliopsis zonata CBS 506.65 TaxID=1073090 RepID=A0A1L9ST06_9EURO|nr:hypothetical protein ASPZODRAFT_128863 [Penicilliopsis zonata CBS 506.65]OJJ50237.1 hypothetical protein ASPZODRAFT_128863 [Penicilliopsis zonata CBS 506.65]